MTSGFSWGSTAEEVTRGTDGTGLVAIVTGGSSGIGKETSRVLALRGVHVIMAVRNVVSCAQVKEALITEIPTARIDVMELDLSSFSSIRKFASEFNLRALHLNILINNAGITGIPFTLSTDNVELQFATNYLGHFLLTNLLLENMKNASNKSGREGRIVIVSSAVHKYSKSNGIVSSQKVNDKSSYYHFFAYAQSKRANVLHANELARRLKEEGVNITVNSLHPGVIRTNILRHGSIVDKFCVSLLFPFSIKTIEQGAATTCYVALNPKVEGVSGEYFDDNNISKAATSARDMNLAKKLWDFSLALTGE